MHPSYGSAVPNVQKRNTEIFPCRVNRSALFLVACLLGLATYSEGHYSYFIWPISPITLTNIHKRECREKFWQKQTEEDTPMTMAEDLYACAPWTIAQPAASTVEDDGELLAAATSLVPFSAPRLPLTVATPACTDIPDHDNADDDENGATARKHFRRLPLLTLSQKN